MYIAQLTLLLYWITNYHGLHILLIWLLTLNFLKHNLSCYIKAAAFFTIVCPSMEYTAVIWDPYYPHNNIQQLEKVQYRAARWVLNDFNRFSSVTAMIQHLSWPSLISRLQTLVTIMHQDHSLSIPSYFISMTRSTRLYHPHHFILPYSFTYSNSFTYSHQQSFSQDQLRIGTTYHLP